MANNSTSFNSGSSFKIQRPIITTSGFVSSIDPTVKIHLDELNTLLGKSIFNRSSSSTKVTPDIEDLLKLDLTPKYVPPVLPIVTKGTVSTPSTSSTSPTPSASSTPSTSSKMNDWDDKSIASNIDRIKEADVNISMSDLIDITPEISILKDTFAHYLSTNWLNLDYNTKTVLEGYPAIRDYLIAYGFYVMKLEEFNALKNFILSNRLGAKNVTNYAIISAARTIVDADKLEVDEYNVDDSKIVNQIKAARLSLSSASFRSALQKHIDDYIFNDKESKLIDVAEAVIGKLPPDIKPLLIKYIKRSPVTISAANAQYFLPLFISQISGSAAIIDRTEDPEEFDNDFDVQPLENDNSLIKISQSAVKCAAQLYYGMILGDELDVFNTMNYFTHKYSIRGGIEIQDSQLREDLQMYVFSNRFTDLKTKKVMDRTRPAERQMFYRQVFDYGHAQVTDDFILNKEFTNLWKVLVLESAKYIERAQSSFNPDVYVSKQNVMQSVEDIQYNLSTHCTGMANVITPLIYAELNFIIQRIFMHPEILRQIVPAGGTWWRVVETLYMGMKNVRPKATVLYNKAMFGYQILRSIADYEQTPFQQDENFIKFISLVEAFITTQSILQESLTDDLKMAEKGEYMGNGMRTTMPEPMPASAPGAKAGDEWDF